MDDPLLDLDARRRIFVLVQQYPGIHTRELARQAQTSVALVEYHVGLLLESGLITEQRDERYQRLFPAAGGGRAAEKHRDALAVLRRKGPLRVALFLLEHRAPAHHKEVCAALGLGKSNVTFHLHALRKAGVVAKEADGRFAVRERAAILRLLHENPPLPELRDEFADLWLALYGE